MMAGKKRLVKFLGLGNSGLFGASRRMSLNLLHISSNVVRAVPLGVGVGGFAGSTGKPQRCAPRLLEKPLPEGEEKTGFGPGPPQEESALHGSLDPPQNEPVPGGRPASFLEGQGGPR